MGTSYEYRNRRGLRRRLNSNTLELDAVARRLKSAFPVEPELDEEVDRRIMAKVDDKRLPRPRAARRWGHTWKLALAGGLLTAILGVVLLTEGIRILGRDSAAKLASYRDNPAIASDLPVVGSFEKLKTLLAEAGQAGGVRPRGRERSSLLRAPALDMPLAKSSLSSADYSTTNVQVLGVDEADIVKTDGVNVYQVNGERIVIARLNPPDEMRLLNVIRYKAEEFSPIELYVDGKYLTVIGRSFRAVKAPSQRQPDIDLPLENVPPFPLDYREPVVKVIAYDLSDSANPVKIREAEIDGEYVSSRKIGSALYLVANKYVDLYRIQQETTETAQETGFLRPGYRDSAGRREFKFIDYSAIRYFPGSAEPNYLMVAGLNLDRPQEQMRVSTYLGAGQNVYASLENLYVAATVFKVGEGTPAPEPRRRPSPMYVPAVASTNLYRFALNDGHVVYQAKGEIPGALLNQFSMDEHKGYFRVATTKGEVWAEGEAAAKNNVYVLNKDMAITGRLENVASGERIYSVRFMGDRAYMVTFKKVDPLFVIDLSNPPAPKILGELKIPGYSDYLHPYDENHIIGFGKDTVEAPASGQESGRPNFAYYQGMKIAMFDVTDVERPIEKFKTIIGDRGTESELLRNHKALLFDKARNLMAFPVTVMEVKNKPAGGGREAPQPGVWPAYGDFAFQGAYVYNISLDKGMQLKGRITHLPEGAQPFMEPGSTSKQIERILYIGDTLYTVSKGLIKANGIADLREKKSLALDAAEPTR
ncbi:MAG: beta-propeller domain-containing protein [Actinobacteria bacterium]|nr:beta-propeller domain-containing protein [Actinomycetota bacterium]